MRHPLHLLAAAVVLAAGCARAEAPEEAGSEEAGTAPLGETTPVRDRPAGMMDSLTVAGTKVPARLTLLASPRSFPAPFSTYVPSDLEADFVRRGGASALRLTAALGGIAVETASLEVVFPGEAGAARPLLDSLEAEGWSSEEADAGALEPWARRGWRLRRPMPGGDRHEGWLALGERRGQPFYVLVRHPSGLSGGLVPRIETVLDRWRWEDDKSPLRARAARPDSARASPATGGVHGADPGGARGPAVTAPRMPLRSAGGEPVHDAVDLGFVVVEVG